LNPRHMETLRTIATMEAVQDIRERATAAEADAPDPTPYTPPRNRHERRKAAALARRAAR